jgi:hypothetical protein
MAILDAMLRDGTVPGMTFPEHAAWAVSLLETE